MVFVPQNYLDKLKNGYELAFGRIFEKNELNVFSNAR
jgi:hypothetical protein